jgi:trimethylamine---corrinoid protein Co-methyltransferase
MQESPIAFGAQSAIDTLRPAIRMLSPEQIQTIHQNSLEILSDTGIRMEHEAARDLLLEAGAQQAAERIKIPPHLVMEAIDSAAPRIPMHNRLGDMTMLLGGDNVFFGSGSDCLYTVDVDSGERRQTTANDVERIATLCDGLGQLDFVMGMGSPSDVPPLDHYLHSFINMLRGTAKPVLYTAKDRTDLEDIYRIACAVAGGETALQEKPFLLHYSEPISPLRFNEESVDKLLFCAEKGIPVTYVPSPNTGAGGPVTLAGAIALGNAECLTGLLLAQLVRRGTPFLYGVNTAALDMRSTIVSYGSPEYPMGTAAFCDLCRHYNLPVWGTAGATDSKVVDAQAGIEAAISIMMACLCRSNLNHDVGYIEYGSTSSMEMLVVCNEIISEARYIMGGVEVSERTLAREAIRRAQPGGGFLNDDHTLDNWREAQWRPALLDRDRHGRWMQQGGKDMAARANEQAREIVAAHKAPPLPQVAEDEIADVLRERADGPMVED